MGALTSLCKAFDLTRGPLGAQNAFHWAICGIFWMHTRAARVDLGPQEGVAPQSPLRVTSVFVGKMSVWCVLGANWRPKVV